MEKMSWENIALAQLKKNPKENEGINKLKIKEKKPTRDEILDDMAKKWKKWNVDIFKSIIENNKLTEEKTSEIFKKLKSYDPINNEYANRLKFFADNENIWLDLALEHLDDFLALSIDRVDLLVNYCANVEWVTTEEILKMMDELITLDQEIVLILANLTNIPWISNSEILKISQRLWLLTLEELEWLNKNITALENDSWLATFYEQFNEVYFNRLRNKGFIVSGKNSRWEQLVNEHFAGKVWSEYDSSDSEIRWAFQQDMRTIEEFYEFMLIPNKKEYLKPVNEKSEKDK